MMKMKPLKNGVSAVIPAKRSTTGLSILVALVLVASCTTEQKRAATPPGDDPLMLLEQGNQRFIEGDRRSAELVQERAVLAAGQHPYAVVLTCSDSRVPPELVFDESLGRLFVI